MHVIDDAADFELQMKSLSQEADHLSHEEQAAPKMENLAKILKPLVQGIDALGRVTSENTRTLERLEASVAAQAGLPEVLAALRTSLEQKEVLNQKQFDALHDELRSYKDDFLLDVFHKPIVRDLITLFDDLSALHRQTAAFLVEQAGNFSPALQKTRLLSTNLDHAVHSVLEILARMEVHRVEASTGRLDKQNQRAVSVEMAETQEDDQMIVASLKPGFLWRERLLRPEEVVIRKWKEGCLVELAPAQK